jgi:hypothetical protein
LVAVGEAARQRSADKWVVGFGHAALYLKALRLEQVGFKSTRVMTRPCGSTGKPNRARASRPVFRKPPMRTKEILFSFPGSSSSLFPKNQNITDDAS